MAILMAKNSSNCISLLHENEIVNDEVEVANLFNDYFVNIGHHLVDKLNVNFNNNPMSFMGESLNNSFVFHSTNSVEISKLIDTF